MNNYSANVDLISKIIFRLNILQTIQSARAARVDLSLKCKGCEDGRVENDARSISLEFLRFVDFHPRPFENRMALVNWLSREIQRAS